MDFIYTEKTTTNFVDKALYDLFTIDDMNIILVLRHL